MKLKTLVLLLNIILLSSACIKANTTEINNDADPILIGNINLEDIENLEWYKESYQNYKPSTAVIEKIKQHLQDKDLYIEVYFGTWCPDSQYEVPQLIKLLHALDFDMSKLTLVGLGRDKKVPNVDEAEAKKLAIEMIPTFIFKENGEERNRFVEFARESLEKDVLAIVSDNQYKHSYE